MRFVQARLVVAIALAASLSSCGGHQASSPPVTTAAPAAAIHVPATNAALSDGVVSRRELEQLYVSYVGCLHDSGVVGRVAYDLDLGSDMVTDLRMRDDADRSGAMITAADNACRAAIDPAIARYTPPAGPSIERRKITRLTDCVASLAPNIVLPVEPTLSYSQLYSDALNLPDVLAAEARDPSGYQRCAEVNYGPWRQIP